MSRRPPRRAETRAGRAVVLVAVAVVVGVGLLTRLGSPAPTRTSSPTTTPTTARSVAPTTTTTLAAPIPPSQIKLQVLNGLLAGSLSAQFSARLSASPGYQTLAANNATSVVHSSAIYIVTSGYLPEAEELAHTVGLPLSDIVRTVPPPSSAPIPSYVLSEANLVLVVGPGLASRG